VAVEVHSFIGGGVGICWRVLR